MNPPSGCPFHTRCPRKIGTICETQEPPVREPSPGHRIACHISEDELQNMAPVISQTQKSQQAAQKAGAPAAAGQGHGG
jgi:peptide/nickel transport system ATP-binding protein